LADAADRHPVGYVQETGTDVDVHCRSGRVIPNWAATATGPALRSTDQVVAFETRPVGADMVHDHPAIFGHEHRLAGPGGEDDPAEDC